MSEAMLALRGYMPRERAAVSALFFANGYVVGSWAAKIPQFKVALGIDEAALGLLILAFGVGSLLMMPVAGGLIAREGSRRVAYVAGFASAPLLLLLTLMPNVWAAAAVLALTGGIIGGMDVAMNANAVSVEREMKRAIMSSCHAWWSVGGLVGAATGGVLLGQVGPVGHALVITAAVAVVVAAAMGSILHDRADAGAAEAAAPKVAGPAAAGWRGYALPLLVGVVALFSMIPEGAILDWGGIYLHEELGASVEVAGFAFAGFAAAMAVMRFIGDPIRDRLGAVLTLRVSTLVAGAGLLIAASASGPALAATGFAVAGLGIANMVPIAFSAGGNLPGLAPGIGLSIVTTMGYSGLLFAPSLIGFIARTTGLGPIYVALPLLYIVVLVLSGLARHADPEPRTSAIPA